MALKDRFEAAYRDIRVVDEVMEIAAGFNMVDWRATHDNVALTGTIRGIYSKVRNNIDSPLGTITGFEFAPGTNENMNLGYLQGGLINPIVKGSSSNAVLTMLKGLHLKCETEETRGTPTVTIQDVYGLFLENDIKGGNAVITRDHYGAVIKNFGTSAKMGAGLLLGSGDSAATMDYGVDMGGSIQGVSNPAAINNAPVRMNNDVCLLTGSGVPTDGTSGTGAGFAGIGSLYIRYDVGTVYVNNGTKASPVWKLVTQAA